MAQPVWVLSVDLQTKTATFQTGLAEAARSARGAFGEIRSGAGEMAVGVSKGSIDVRHSLGLVDNVIRGAHAQAMADLVRMYAQSALVMNTLPIAAAAAGLALIGGIAYEAYEHFKKLKEEQEKLADDFTRMGTAGNNAFRQIDDEILKAQQHADELHNDHLAALNTQLELIDHQSMDELVKALGTVEKAADEVFKALQGHWYTFGSGSAGASHALEEFKVQYDNLMSAGDGKGASDLLHGTLESAKEILQLQQTVNSNRHGSGLLGANITNADAYYAAQMRLRQLGAGYTKSEMESQQALVTALEQQVGIEERVNTLKGIQGQNARTEEGQGAASRRAAAARDAAEAQLSMGQSALAGAKAQADAQLTIHHATLEAQLSSDLSFAQRERDMKEAANQAEIAALDKGGKDYTSQLRALNDKRLEIEQQYDTEIAELKARAAVEINQRDTQALEQGIREQIDGTQQGSAARIAAIDAGIREEQAHQLQNSSFYRDLLLQRVQAARQMGEAQATAEQEAANESARHEMFTGSLRLNQQKQTYALYDSGHHASRSQIVEQQKTLANEEYSIKMAALQKQVDALNKGGKDYENRLRELQDRESELTQEHENRLSAIMLGAESQRNDALRRGADQRDQDIAHGLTESIMRHQTWAQMMTNLSNQVVSGMLENALKDMMADDMTRERDAAYAARKAFIAGMHLPFPANLVAAPTLAAGAFATVMAFAGGTDYVHGDGRRGDHVPAMLEDGEGVVPGGVMDGLRTVARNGGFQDHGPRVHVLVSPTYHVQTIDGDGMQKALDKHSEQIQRHVERAIRRVNH